MKKRKKVQGITPESTKDHTIKSSITTKKKRENISSCIENQGAQYHPIYINIKAPAKMNTFTYFTQKGQKKKEGKLLAKHDCSIHMSCKQR